MICVVSEYTWFICVGGGQCNTCGGSLVDGVWQRSNMHFGCTLCCHSECFLNAKTHVRITGSISLWIYLSSTMKIFLPRAIKACESCKPSLRPWVADSSQLVCASFHTLSRLKQPEILQENFKKKRSLSSTLTSWEYVIRSAHKYLGNCKALQQTRNVTHVQGLWGQLCGNAIYRYTARIPPRRPL